MTREQALQQLKNPHLTTSEQEHIHQYLFYLDQEGVTPKPSYPNQREASTTRKAGPQRKKYPPKRNTQ